MSSSESPTRRSCRPGRRWRRPSGPRRRRCAPDAPSKWPPPTGLSGTVHPTGSGRVTKLPPPSPTPEPASRRADNQSRRHRPTRRAQHGDLGHPGFDGIGCWSPIESAWVRRHGSSSRPVFAAIAAGDGGPRRSSPFCSLSRWSRQGWRSSSEVPRKNSSGLRRDSSGLRLPVSLSRRPSPSVTVILELPYASDWRPTRSNPDRDTEIGLVDTLTATRYAGTLEGHISSVYAVAFAPDGQTLASASTTGRCCCGIWPTGPGRAVSANG